MKLNNLTLGIFAFILTFSLSAQKKVTLKVEPTPTVVELNKPTQIKVLAFDEEGNQLGDTQTNYWPVQLRGVDENMIFTKGIEVDTAGVVTATQIGEYDIFIFRMPGEGEAFARTQHKVQVVYQPVAEINILESPTQLYQGSMTQLNVEVIDKGGAVIENPDIEVTSSNATSIQTDNFMNIYANETGKSTITIKADDLSATIDLQVVKNPVDRLNLTVNSSIARTGDVLQFTASTLDKSGKEVTGVPVNYSVSGMAASPGSGSSAMIGDDGRFVAEDPGSYVITATTGNRSASKAVQIGERGMSRTVKLIGQGRVSDQRHL